MLHEKLEDIKKTLENENSLSREDEELLELFNAMDSDFRLKKFSNGSEPYWVFGPPQDCCPTCGRPFEKKPFH